MLVIQPDSELGAAIAWAIELAGHAAVVVAAARWAIPLIRANPPDVVLLERAVARCEGLCGLMKELAVDVPVLMTRLLDVPAFGARSLAGDALVRRVERAASRPRPGSR